jgi:hypothetical protein
VFELPCTTVTLLAVLTLSVGGAITVNPTEAAPLNAAPVVLLTPVPPIVSVPAPAVAVLPTVTVTVELAPAFTEAGLNETVTPLGAVAAKATEPVKLPVPVTATVKEPDLPGNRDTELTEALSVNPCTGGVGTVAPHTLASTFASTEPSPVARL